MSLAGLAQSTDEAVLAPVVLSHIAVSAAAMFGSDRPLSENRYYGCVVPGNEPAGIGRPWPQFDVVVRNTTIKTADAFSPRRFGGPAATAPRSFAWPHLRRETPQRRQKREAYEARIAFLQEEARQDGYTLNPASRRDFERFALGADEIRSGGLVLLDNGNLRALWRDGQGARLGLQFLGGGTVQYVIFKRRTGARSVSRVAGRDSLEGLERQLAAFDMRSLLYE